MCTYMQYETPHSKLLFGMRFTPSYAKPEIRLVFCIQVSSLGPKILSSMSSAEVEKKKKSLKFSRRVFLSGVAYCSVYPTVFRATGICMYLYVLLSRQGLSTSCTVPLGNRAQLAWIKGRRSLTLRQTTSTPNFRFSSLLL